MAKTWVRLFSSLILVHWSLNNSIFQGIEMLSLGSFKTGAILLVRFFPIFYIGLNTRVVLCFGTTFLFMKLCFDTTSKNTSSLFQSQTFFLFYHLYATRIFQTEACLCIIITNRLGLMSLCLPPWKKLWTAPSFGVHRNYLLCTIGSYKLKFLLAMLYVDLNLYCF